MERFFRHKSFINSLDKDAIKDKLDDRLTKVIVDVIVGVIIGFINIIFDKVGNWLSKIFKSQVKFKL